ncbi:hypothetical protein [Methanoregula sp.]|uniref:hypothetical protein n=1 Tax=Methanoregula sp. TaxID=2052170 RepID=UPI002374E5E6|nr:hypothetical protein [Methanoregula sp.]MDD1686383.1 hypothetical protein [Methanoregula sp.]
MTEKRTCDKCGKEAIGFQSIGCCFAYVCQDHAESLLLDLKPGEKKSSGECYVERFDTDER